MRKKPDKYFCRAVLLLFILSVPLRTAFAMSDGFVLKKEMKGDQVTRLQDDLKQLGFFCRDSTGYYGDITEAAVSAFQKKYGLAADGKAGENTLNKINSVLGIEKSMPVFKKGMNSPEVTGLQRSLKQLGFFTLGPTGYYGDATENAVIKFQKSQGIAPDGKMDAITYDKINASLKQAKPFILVIDPGHGGIDPGASKGNVVESEVNLSIAKKLRDSLVNYGYEAVLTRSKDAALDSQSHNGATRQERDLNARTNIINSSGAEFFVSIHVDSLPESPSTSGSTVYYNRKNLASKELARNIQKALNGITAKGLKRQSHDCERADYYILRNSNVPGVLVETAFITNSRERKLLAADSFRDMLAKAILEGIEKTRYN